jgi:superfamily II DNA/RNA helicase
LRKSDFLNNLFTFIFAIDFECDNIFKQIQHLRNCPQIIVGTPGRVIDHLERKTLSVHDVGFLVLDEADRMFDMGFGVQLDQIMSKLPQERQSLMFSATFPASIEKLASKHLKSPERVLVGSVVSPIANIKQEIVKVSEGDKYAKLLSELESREGSVIIFVKTKMATERLAEKLQNDHQTAIAIHGDLKQQKRERVINIFRRGGARVMVATDVVARGLDIPHIQHVVNYDLPQCPEDYIHRSGRTARAGATGHSLCLITPQDSKKWNIIQKFMDPEASVSGKAFEESRQGSSKSHRGRSNDRKPGDYQGRGGRSEGGFGERRSS